jgi:hypothetical protein
MDEYQHSVFCSASPRYPRTPGVGCSCHSIDLNFNRLMIQRNGENAKRTIHVAQCSGCQNRKEFAFDAPKESFCDQCRVWVPVQEISWEGLDLAKLLPVKKGW